MTACDAGGKLDADLFLLVGGKGVDDAVDGLGRAGRVQRAENQVARFRRRDGRFHRFQVAHFADQESRPGPGASARRKRFGEVRHVHVISRCVTTLFLCL